MGLVKVRLLNDGGYCVPEIVGKVVSATARRDGLWRGYDVTFTELYRVGMLPDSSDVDTTPLFFTNDEVELIHE